MTAKLLLVLPVIALLAACTTGGGTTGDGGGTTGDSGGSGTSSGADCSVFDGTEAEPFSSDLISSAPAPGSVWGDGTAFAIQLSDEAIAAELLPQVEFLSISDGSLLTATNQIFDDDGNGAFSNRNNVFDDDLEGEPGIAQVFAITDASFDGENYHGDKLILGDYCITFRN